MSYFKTIQKIKKNKWWRSFLRKRKIKKRIIYSFNCFSDNKKEDYYKNKSIYNQSKYSE